MEVGGCAHGQDAGTTADIEDDLVLEEVAVLVDGIAVAASAHIIFLKQSSLVNSHALSLVWIESLNCGATYEHLLVDSVVVVAAHLVSLAPFSLVK